MVVVLELAYGVSISDISAAQIRIAAVLTWAVKWLTLQRMPRVLTGPHKPHFHEWDLIVGL